MKVTVEVEIPEGPSCTDCSHHIALGQCGIFDGEGMVFVGGALEFYKLAQCAELCRQMEDEG